MCMYVWLYLLVQCALYTYGCMVYEYCHGDNSRFNWQLSQMSVDPLTAEGLETVLGSIPTFPPKFPQRWRITRYFIGHAI